MFPRRFGGHHEFAVSGSMCRSKSRSPCIWDRTTIHICISLHETIDADLLTIPNISSICTLPTHENFFWKQHNDQPEPAVSVYCGRRPWSREITEDLGNIATCLLSQSRTQTSPGNDVRLRTVVASSTFAKSACNVVDLEYIIGLAEKVNVDLKL